MNIDKPAVRARLKNFDLTGLFTQELGWDFPAAGFTVSVASQDYALGAIAQKRGVQVFQCAGPDGRIPDYATRRKIEKQVAKHAYEHLIIFVDKTKTTQIWQWVARQPGTPAQYREHPYFPQQQSGDALIQKLSSITIPLSDEEALDLTGTVHRLRDAFDRDRVTKKFYDRFKIEHAAFLAFIKGVEGQADRGWYASLMLNRLMFIYFIQEKGFLDGNRKYLSDRLAKVRASRGKGKFHTFYRYFLLALFHEGFAKEKGARTLDADLNALLGDVPYVNGGLFEVHALEERNPKIEIPDEAFERLFTFFGQWDWHLDTRPLRDEREINPDVLGYIFEKYINQKQMGAYYTKEDITEYISKSTIVPYLFDAARKGCAVAFEPGSALWRLLIDDPDRYIYKSVRYGVVRSDGQIIPLPEAIAAGVTDVSKRGGWNRPAPEGFALPTETWREHVARRQRCLEIREKLRRGEVHEINDLVTLNLDLRQFAEDVISGSEGPELLRAFWHAIREVTVLDPTCGSGAFLFAALGILQPLYEACLDRMQAFVEDLGRSGAKHSPKKFGDFRKVLAEIDGHPNRDYFILKTLIVGNLHGVDIMEEAVEICKLRLFLKLVAQVETADQLEPLPDVDFNVRAGNTLVGFATLDDVKKSLDKKHSKTETIALMPGFDEQDQVARIVEDAEIVDRAFQMFREMQTEQGVKSQELSEGKKGLRDRLGALAGELDRHLAGEYGIDADRKPKDFAHWRTSHQPFHWFAEFHGIMKDGGFDVIIGNPPYVEYAKVRDDYSVGGVSSLNCGNLYVYVFERSKSIAGSAGRLGLIVPLSFVCTERMSIARSMLKNATTWLPSFDIRPSSLFEGIAQRLTIVIQNVSRHAETTVHAGGYRRWGVGEREGLFALTCYVRTDWASESAPVTKIACATESSVIQKMAGPRLAEFLDQQDKQLYIHRICRYFIKAVDFVPFFRDATGEIGRSDDYKPFSFLSEHRDSILCYVGSTLFYWHWRAHGDGFHCGYGDVYRSPWIHDLSRSAKRRLSGLSVRLTKALTSSSTNKTIRTKKGDVTYQEFSASSTKPILDEIDAVLAGEFGLTDAELDFIINYDIKYRMGSDAGEDDE